ncbi:MAG: Rap1a/Tai family immunity protein [Gammaproteobacteria bacterium]
MIARALLLPLFVASLPATAAFDTGNRLYEDCSAENYFNRGYCGGYVVGIVDTIEALQGRGVLPANALCIPEGATKGQLVDVVLKYLGDNPDRRHLDAGALVPEALNRAFPCAS